MKNSKLLLALSGLVALMLQVGATWGATAGYVQFVNGQVSLTTEKGVTHALQKGEAVNEGDTVSTKPAASAQIRMQDGGFIAVRPDTQLKFDSFKFTGQAGKPESSFFSLFRGGFRAVTGLIGRINKQDYRITTPAATIGVRGTDHETVYLPKSMPGAMAGAYSKVNIGETSLTTNKGTVNVLPNQMGFAGGLNQAPQLQPINTTIFTVSAAPTKTIKESKEERKDSDKAQGGNQKKQVAAETGNRKPAETKREESSDAVEPVRAIAVVDNTKLAENVRTTAPATSAAPESKTESLAAPKAPEVVLAVKASSGSLVLDITEQTVTSGNTTVSVQDGIYSVQAKTAADAALVAAQAADAAKVAATNANTMLLAIATVSTTPATTAIGTATTNIGTATPVVSTAVALTPANATTAATNATNAQTATTAANTQAVAAQSAITANGTFADTTAVAANTVINTPTTGANALVQTANTTVQTNAAAVTTQNTALSTAKNAASTALASANTNLATANSTVATVGTQNTAITSAQTAAASSLSAAQAAATAAQTAATAAQTAATLAASMQAAGDLTGAAAQLKIAQDQLAIAKTQQANAIAAQAAVATQLANAQAAQTAANTAVTNATSAAITATSAATAAQTQATTAGTAATAASNALTATTTQLAVVNTNAATVATNAPIAAYNNPANATGVWSGATHVAQASGAGWVQNLSTVKVGAVLPAALLNTSYVLDGSGSLVEMRHISSYAAPTWMSGGYTSGPIADADIKFSGGTAADSYTFTSGANVLGYMGRWQGGNMTITDNLVPANTTTNPLGALSVAWMVGLDPAPNYIQSLVGTTSYTSVASVRPTDSAGNVGVLNSASLTADFTTQLVNTAINLTINNQTLDVTASNLAIFGSHYEANPETGNGPTIMCTGTGCSGGSGVPNSYLGRVSGIFLGDATAVVSPYSIWPTAAPGSVVSDIIFGAIGFNAATPTVGTNPAAGTYRGGAFANVLVTGGAISAETKGGVQPNTNFILDASGNLVKILSTSYQEQPVMPNANPTPIANAQISYSGGVAADYFKMADNSLTFGRWQGGNMTVRDNVTGISTVKPLLAANSITPLNSFWILLTPVAANYTQGLIGTATYSNIAAVQPTDSLGNVGVLNSATLSANFTTMTVDETANLTIAAKTFNLQSLGLPIVADSFQADLVVGNGTGPMATTTCAGATCATTYQSRFGGMFLGSAASSALVNYSIWPTTTAGAAALYIIEGVIAFNTGTAPTVGPPKAYNPNHIAVEMAGGLNFNSGMLAAPANLTYITGGTGNNSTSGALSSMTFRDFGGGSGWSQIIAITGGTASSANAPAYATTGIQYGEWTGYTGQSNTWSSLLGGNNGSAPTSWMYGPEGYVDAANVALFAGTSAGTFNYAMDGGTAPRSQNTGLTGTLTSASMTVDFLNMLLSGSMTLTMPGNENWGASITNEPILAGGTLNAIPVVTYGAGAAATTCTTCSGNVNGAFTGQNFAGAIVSYQLYNNNDPAGGDVMGNVALTRVGVAGNPTVTDGTPAATGNTVVATDAWGGVQTYPTAGVTTTGNVLTAFGSSGPGGSFTTTVDCPTCTSTAAGQVASSGIYYGNWTEGLFTQSYSATFTAGMMPPSYWITGPEAGPLYLPQALIGTASYAFDAGQVSNGMGVAGTVVSTTTTLALDFNKQTVGINLDVSIDDTATTSVVHTWNVQTVSGKEAVLGNSMGVSGAGFNASTYNNGSGSGSGLLTVTVDGSAANVTGAGGNINGQLTGVGLNGAIMSFNLNGLLTAGTYESINGVAAFTGTGTAQDVATSHRYVATSFYDPFAVIPQPMFGFYANNEARVTQDVAGLAGNLMQFDMQIMSNNGGNGSSMIFAQNTSTLANQGSDAVSGISWGRWSGGGFNATDRVTGTGILVDQTTGGSLHWIAESAATAPTTLPVVGTYTYINAGGTTPTDNTGVTGTLNSATLTADFTARTVNLGVNATVAGAMLNAVGANVPIIQKTVFYASSQEVATSTSHLAVTCSGTCGTGMGGAVIGKFTGAGAIGAAMTYGLQHGANVVSGVVAFHQ